MAVATTVALAGCAGNEQTTQAGDPAAPGATAGVQSTSGISVATAKASPQYREVTLPTGTQLALELKSGVGSDTSRIEEAVRATLRQPIAIEGREVLPAGTEVAGNVTDAEESGRVKGRARVAFRFNTLNHDGARYDISTAQIAREAEATKGEDATKIGIGAGAGAAIGALLGGGDGAAKGAAIGGAAGTGAVLATKGKEIRLGPGANVATRLTAPLTVRVRVS